MPNRTYLSLCAIAKDEDSIVREWVAYHHAIGFERIFIYDNDSKIPIRDLLADFYDQGIVETYTMPGKAMQLIAYNHFLQNHGHEFVWTAFFDLDEFLVLPSDIDARALMAEYENYPCLSVNWGSFGSAGHLKRPSGLVMESFCEIQEEDTNTKCIVQPRYIKMPLSPHHFVFADAAPGMTMRAVNTRREFAVGAYVPVATERARLNHYRFRSQQDFEERLQRGDAVYLENPRELNSFYHQAKHRGKEDTLILRHAARVREILATGKAMPYCPVESMFLSGQPMPVILQHMTTALKKGRPETAFVIFSVTHRLFPTDADFLRMGIGLALACGLLRQAEELTCELIELVPELSSYQRLLTVQLQRAKKGEPRHFAKARHTADFIMAAAVHLNDHIAAEEAKNTMVAVGG